MRTQIQGLDTCLKLTKLDLSDNELTDLKVRTQGLGFHKPAARSAGKRLPGTRLSTAIN